jgi:hypothetical protein
VTLLQKEAHHGYMSRQHGFVQNTPLMIANTVMLVGIQKRLPGIRANRAWTIGDDIHPQSQLLPSTTGRGRPCIQHHYSDRHFFTCILQVVSSDGRNEPVGDWHSNCFWTTTTTITIAGAGVGAAVTRYTVNSRDPPHQSFVLSFSLFLSLLLFLVPYPMVPSPHTPQAHKLEVVESDFKLQNIFKSTTLSLPIAYDSAE